MTVASDLNHPLFTLIREEHAEAIQRIRDATSTDAKRALVPWLWQEVEHGHHHREEKYLYPLLLPKPRLQEGGPYCMHYFHEHLSYSPRQEAESLAGKALPWLEHQSAFRERKSPLDIPVEEHRAMYLLMETLERDGARMDDEKFLGFFLPYARLLTRHSEKEEHCFFHLVTWLLSPAELDAAMASWQADMAATKAP